MKSILTMFVSGGLLASSALAVGTLDLAAPGRPATDLKRDAADHPQDVLAFAGVQPVLNATIAAAATAIVRFLVFLTLGLLVSGCDASRALDNATRYAAGSEPH